MIEPSKAMEIANRAIDDVENETGRSPAVIAPEVHLAYFNGARTVLTNLLCRADGIQDARLKQVYIDLVEEQLFLVETARLALEDRRLIPDGQN